MSRAKHLVAALILVHSFSANAGNFRAADQVYVPIAGHASGSSGLFMTDAFITNFSPSSVDVSVMYVPLGPNAGSNAPGIEELRGRITLRPNESRAFPDILVNTLGKAPESNPLGMLIFSGCRSGADCGPSTQDANGYSENFRPISVETRIFQITQAGSNPPTTGQLFSGIPWYSAASSLFANVGLDRVLVTGLSHTGSSGQPGTYRANLGVVNVSEYSSTEIVFRLYQGTISDADKKGEAVRTLGPLGNMQYGFAQLFPDVKGTNFFVVIEQRNVVPITGTVPPTCVMGCPGFLAYGSVLDNISGDATTMEAQFFQEVEPRALEIIHGSLPHRRAARH